MDRIKEENYFVVQGWMISELNLKGNELIIYAIIYGYSQTNNQWFTGSREYLSYWINSSIRTVQTILNSLIEKKLIEKEYFITNNKYCKYRSIYKRGEKISLPEVKKFPERGEKISPNNIEDNIDNISTTITTIDNSKSIFEIIEENFGRTLNSIEYETIQKWSEYNFPFDLLKHAVSKAVLKNIYNISYIDKILYEWNKNNIRTVAQAQKSDEEHENKKQNKQNYKHHKTQREREEEAIAKFLSESDD